MTCSGPERIVETSEWEGRTLRVTWVPGLVPPPMERIRQASGIVFTKDGRIVVVGDGERWGLPGGHPEPGETVQEAFVREVLEEACAVVRTCGYLGAQQVEDPAEPAPYYQARFWAMARLLPWEPEFEIVARQLVPADELVKTLDWRTSRIVSAIVDSAMAAKMALEAAWDTPDGRTR